MKNVLRPLELLLRHGIVYPLLKLVFHNKERHSPIPLRSVKKLLILRYDRIGDIIVTTPVFRRLKHFHPGLFIGVVASPANAELVQTNSFVDRLHILPKHWWHLPRFLREARQEQYDVVLNFIFNRTTSGGVLANLIAPSAIKVGQGADKYKFYFNRLLRLERGEDHMATVLLKYVDTVFGLPKLKSDPLFEIIVPDSAKQTVASFLNRSGVRPRKFIVLNISAAETVRKISHQQTAFLAHVLSMQCREAVVMISAPADLRMREEIASSSGRTVFSFPPHGNTDMLTIAALLGESKAVITPDTSVIHLASAMRVPVMGLYTPLQVTNEWLPHGVSHRIVLASQNEPVSSISEKTIEVEVKLFLKSLKKKKRPPGSRSTSPKRAARRK